MNVSNNIRYLINLCIRGSVLAIKSPLVPMIVTTGAGTRGYNYCVKLH